MAKKENVLTSPKAPCLFAYLNKPDTEYKELGEYKVTLLFDEDHPFINKLQSLADQLWKEAKANMKPAQANKAKAEYPFKPDTDPETGEETGKVRVTFKTNATYVDKKTGEIVKKKLKVFNAANKLMKVCPIVCNGSVLNVNFEYVVQYVQGKLYLSLYLQAVRIVDLVEFAPDGGAMFGEAEEGGYDGEGDEFANPVAGEDTVDEEEEF